MAEYYSKEQLLENARTTWCDMYDLEDFLRELPTADVVPRVEVEKWFRECEELQVRMIELEKEVAREIFEEIEAVLAVHTLSGKSKDYADGAFDTLEWVDTKLAGLKNKYTEGAKND